MSGVSFAAEVLQRDPAGRGVNVGLLILVLTLMVTRLPLLGVTSGAVPDLATSVMLEDAAATASGRLPAAGEALRPRLSAFVAALPHRMWRAGSLGGMPPEAFEDAVLARPGTSLGLVSLLGFVGWLAVTLGMHRLLAERIDSTVARFAVWLMVISPAGLAAVGGAWPGLLAVPVVAAVLLLAVRMIEQGTKAQYAGAFGLVGLATGFGLHHLTLLLPLAWAHFGGSRMPRESVPRLIFSPRLLLGLLVMVLAAGASHPELWGVARTAAPGGLRAVGAALVHEYAGASWRLVADGEVERLPLTVWRGEGPEAVARDLGLLLGPVGTVLAVLAAAATFVRPDARAWRPVALHALVVVVCRMASPTPGLGWTVAIVPSLAFLLAVNLMGVVRHLGYRRERLVFVVLGVALALGPARLVIEAAWMRGCVSTSDQAAAFLAEQSLGGGRVAQLGSSLATGSLGFRVPRPTASLPLPAAARLQWARALPSVRELRRRGALVVVVVPEFLERLRATLPGEDGARVGRVLDQLRALPLERAWTASEDGSVVGPRVELRKL